MTCLRWQGNRLLAGAAVGGLAAVFLAVGAARSTEQTPGVFDEPIQLRLSPPAGELRMWDFASSSKNPHLALARIYARADEEERALAQYEKAIDSGNDRTRAHALVKIQALLADRRGWRSLLKRVADEWLVQPLRLFAIPVLFLAALTGLLRLLFNVKRRLLRLPARLEVRPLSCWPAADASFDLFQEAVKSAREKINLQEKLAQSVSGAASRTVVPVISTDFLLSNLEVPIEALSDKAWPVIKWLWSLIDPSPFSVDGSLTMDDNSYYLSVALRQGSDTVKFWEQTIRKSQLRPNLQDIAHEVLVELMLNSRT